jgi:hypothetical protein
VFYLFCLIYISSENEATSRSGRAARCIMALPAEEHFCRPSTCGKMVLPPEQLSRQRAVSVYRALQTIYSAPFFRVSVGDALSTVVLILYIVMLSLL